MPIAPDVLLNLTADIDDMIEAIHHPAFVVDKDGLVLSLNKRAVSMSSLPKSSSIGAPCHKVFSCRIPRDACSVCNGSLGNETGTYRVSGNAAKYKVTPVRLGNGERAWVVTILEGSAERITTEFVAISAHELRTPMTTIKALTSLLAAGRYGEITPQQGDVLKNMNRSVDRLVSFANDLITLSRIDGGMMSMDPEEFFPNHVIKDEIRSRNHKMAIREISMVFNGSEVKVYGDIEKYRQVISHILDNAVRYSPDNSGISITVEARDGELVTSVANTGDSIPQDKLPYIFEKFYQCNGVDSALHAGRGLGLAICKGLVELMGGSIHASNHEGGLGVTFTYTIPVKYLPTP